MLQRIRTQHMSRIHEHKSAQMCPFANNGGHIPLLWHWDICRENSESECSETAFLGQVPPALRCCLYTQANHSVCFVLLQQTASVTPELVQVFLYTCSCVIVC